MYFTSIEYYLLYTGVSLDAIQLIVAKLRMSKESHNVFRQKKRYRKFLNALHKGSNTILFVNNGKKYLKLSPICTKLNIWSYRLFAQSLYKTYLVALLVLIVQYAGCWNCWFANYNGTVFATTQVGQYTIRNFNIYVILQHWKQKYTSKTKI